MKRVRVAPGKFVVVSQGMADKAVSGKTGTFVRQTTGHVVVAGVDRAPTKRKAA